MLSKKNNYIFQKKKNFSEMSIIVLYLQISLIYSLKTPGFF